MGSLKHGKHCSWELAKGNHMVRTQAHAHIGVNKKTYMDTDGQKI